MDARITLLPGGQVLEAQSRQTLHRALAQAGLVDAPCGGRGTCGKCRVTVDGQEVLACQTPVQGNMTVVLSTADSQPREKVAAKRAAFDIGTTTLVCYALDDGGRILAQASRRNPQAGFGADVISRIRAALDGQADILTGQLRQAMAQLLAGICKQPDRVEWVAVVGNPAMQQLFLGRSVENLAKIPFSPLLTRGNIRACGECLPCCPEAKLLTVPDISGFVGADTVAGILACGLHEARELTLLVDIGTNGEMVLGNRHGLMACATAAGPALEGAAITRGMRAESGAIDRVWLEDDKLQCHVIGEGKALGICGSGLLDAVAAGLELGLLNRRGRILTPERMIRLTSDIYLTQEDIRQIQLAKGAICAGIRLMAQAMGIGLTDIQAVKLSGAFGSCLNPDSACRIGLLPEELSDRIQAAGNTAGMGAALLAANPELLEAADEIVEQTRYLELSGLPEFPRTFAKAMELPQDWCRSALALGFTQAKAFDPGSLQARADIRAMCQVDKCRVYGKNWMCPPHCGTVEECQRQMRQYGHGILLQTVGQLSKDIDSRGYRATEQRHLGSFRRFCQAIRRQCPKALCLGAGGCRVCTVCAWPEPCRFPDQAVSSMEGYGLFVTQVCREAGLAYHHGHRTVTYTACVLFD